MEVPISKMALSLPHTFAFSCLPRGFCPAICALLIIKELSKRMAGHLNKLLLYLW